MEQKFNIATNKEGVVVIESRQGDALKLKEPTILVESGILTAPADYFEQRVKRYEEEKEVYSLGSEKKAFPNSVVIVDEEAQTISFVSDQSDHYATKVSGIIKYFKNFIDFDINGEKLRPLKDLANFVKRNKSFFKNQEKANQVFLSLLSQKAKITKDIENADDLRGGKKEFFERKIEGAPVIKFDLDIPIFKGDIKRTFEVEVIFDVRNESIQARFESAALFEIELDLVKELLDKQVARFKGEAIIYK